MPRAPANSAKNTDVLLRDITRLFLQAQRSLSACCSDGSAKECEALLLLSRSGPISVQEFAGRMGLEKTWASRLVDRLQKRQLVRRVDHPDDGRSWLLELTAKGGKECCTLDEALGRHTDALLACIPAAERANVERALTCLRDALTTCLATSKNGGKGKG